MERVELRPRSISRRGFLIRGTLVFGGSTLLAACAIPVTQAPNPNINVVVPEAKPIVAVATPSAEANVAASPTVVEQSIKVSTTINTATPFVKPPEAAAVPSPTAKAIVVEASPTPKPENPLPYYGTLWGYLMDVKSGERLGEFMASSIPQSSENSGLGPNLGEMYTYWMSNAGKRSALQSRLRSIKGSHLEGAGLGSADYDDKTKTLIGINHDLLLGQANPSGYKYELNYTGTGREAIFSAMQKMIDDHGDKRITVEQDLKLFKIKTELWP